MGANGVGDLFLSVFHGLEGLRGHNVLLSIQWFPHIPHRVQGESDLRCCVYGLSFSFPILIWILSVTCTSRRGWSSELTRDSQTLLDFLWGLPTTQPQVGGGTVLLL